MSETADPMHKRPRLTLPERLEKARASEQRAADRHARKMRERQKYEAVAKTRERKLDTRRKVIAGALALEHRRHDPIFAAKLNALLDEYVVRDEERALFGLEPLPPARAEDASCQASLAA